jgi:hypothetical protein
MGFTWSLQWPCGGRVSQQARQAHGNGGSYHQQSAPPWRQKAARSLLTLGSANTSGPAGSGLPDGLRRLHPGPWVGVSSDGDGLVVVLPRFWIVVSFSTIVSSAGSNRRARVERSRRATTPAGGFVVASPLGPHLYNHMFVMVKKLPHGMRKFESNRHHDVISRCRSSVSHQPPVPELPR